MARGRLHWRGRELSPEFHEYALRVSQGENLPPFRGRLLADESQALPWESAGEARPLRSKTSRTIGLLLVALGLVAVTGSLTLQEERSTWSQAALAPLVATALQPAAPEVAAPQALLPPAALPPPGVSPPPAPSPPGEESEEASRQLPLQSPPVSSLSLAPLSLAPLSRQPSSLQTPVEGVSRQVSASSDAEGARAAPAPSPQAPSPPVSRQQQPRKVVPSLATGSDEPGKSVLLVEKPPF